MINPPQIWNLRMARNFCGLTHRQSNTTRLHSMMTLTARQEQVFDFIQQKLRDGESAPTQRELAEHFGFRSSKAAADHVNALRRKGWLETERGLARSIRVTSPLQKLRNHVADIPIYGSIPAGFANEHEQEPDGCVTVDVASIN